MIDGFSEDMLNRCHTVCRFGFHATERSAVGLPEVGEDELVHLDLGICCRLGNRRTRRLIEDKPVIH